MFYYCRRIGLCFLSWLLVNAGYSTSAPSATDCVSGSITASATVVHPVGITSGGMPDSEADLTLYCPDRGTVVCSIAYLSHLRQTAGISSRPVFQPSHQMLLTGRIASPIVLAGLSPDDSGEVTDCMITVIYTEN